MIRLKLNDTVLEEAYEIAEREKRSLLGVIYNEYIVPNFYNLDTLNPRNIYATRELVLKMIDLDKSLGTEEVTSMYLQYGPTTRLVIPLEINEIMAVL